MLSEILVVVVAEAASPPLFFYAFSLSFFSPYEVWYGRFDLIYYYYSGLGFLFLPNSSLAKHNSVSN